MGKLIDADAIQYTDLNGDHPESKVRVYVAFKENIDRMPTVDAVSVKHGRWIPCHPLGDDTPEAYMCSVCHVGGWEKTNFCPNCGADMRKDGDDNG